MWIRKETDLTVISHLTCIGATRTPIDALLRDLMSQGIDNILVTVRRSKSSPMPAALPYRKKSGRKFCCVTNRTR